MSIRDRRKAETSARLVAVARKMFFEHGYAQTSMDRLCAEAGVTRGALYHNFGGKEGLFEAVVLQIDAEMVERLLIVAGDTVDLDSFIRTCLAYLEFALEPEIQRIVFQDGPSVLGQRLREIDSEDSIDPLVGAIEELMAAGVFAPANPRALAILLNGAMIDSALWIANQPDKDAALRDSCRALEILLRGLAVQAPTANSQPVP